jgi:D-beta-D-heptose 7-phosphate kinase/D-beta-D-heptose 1-phosphate adenosyltransferase
MKAMTPSRARALLRAMAGRRVLVLGDVMLDEFVWGRVARISPEAPVPVVEVTRESVHLGGAANVAANVCALGGRAVLTGVVGHDSGARAVAMMLDEIGADHALVTAADKARPTTRKTRIVAHHQQVVRTDRESAEPLDVATREHVLASVTRALSGCDALIVSDYQKGVVGPELMRSVLGLARRRRVPVLVDPKVRNFSLFRRVRLITPNQHEAEQATGVRIRGEVDLRAAGRRILATLGCDAALITRGEHGLSLFERGRPPAHVPAAAREVFDVTGAGDTVIATLGLALGAGARLAEAAVLANHAAGVVVAKLGTATATPAEVLAAVESAAERA